MGSIEQRQPQTPSSGLAGLLSIAARATSEDELLAEAASDLCFWLSADGCDILYGMEGGGLVLRASTYAPDYVQRCRLGKGIGISGQAFHGKEPVFISKRAHEDPRFVDYPGMAGERWYGAASIPLEASGDRFGVALLYREAAWAFPARERTRLTKAIAEAGSALGAFRKAFQLGARSSRMGALSEVSRTISASPYLEEILQLLVNMTAQQFQYRVCTVRLLDEERQELVLRATQAQAKAYQRKRAIKFGESIAGRVIVEKQPIMVRDVQVEPDYIGHDLAVEQGLRSMICLPLLLQDRPLGVLTCYTGEVRSFLPEEIAALETLAKQAAIAIEHARLQVRSTLLQEMHHRVKNNLQQVASLLRLQMRHGQYKSLEQGLNDMLGRILAIAAVHELLSREDLDHVGLLTLAETLVAHQRESLVLPDRKIQFLVRGDDVHLNTTQGTQVALILNELIQNAVEHGFKTTLEGEVHVTVENRDGEIRLWVSNNGDKLPEAFDIATAGQLGTQIVDNLARALGGKFKLSDILGWAVAEVSFTRTGGE